MNRLPLILASIPLLLAILLSTDVVSGRNFDEPADIKNDLARLARLYADAQESGKEVDAGKAKGIAEAIKTKYDDLNLIMSIYKSSNKGGIGYDPASKGSGQGIEMRLLELTRKPIAKEQLVKEKELLLRMANFNLAMHDVARQFSPKLKNGNRFKMWTKHNTELKAGSENLLQAVKASDPAALRKAAGRIHSACNECHSEFR